MDKNTNKKERSWIQTIIVGVVLIAVTTGVYLYSSGYRLQKGSSTQIDLTKTGMVSAKSLPDGASVYLDGILMTATDDTIPGIEPGKRMLKIVKKGFIPWEKEIEIFEELVTDITAVLITQSPRLEPITNTGAANPSISPSLAKIAFFSKDETTPGIMIMSLNSGMGVFRSTPSIVLQDTRNIRYSEGLSIEWSHDEKNLLIQSQGNVWYLVDLETNTAQTTNIPQTIKDQWNEKLAEKRKEFIKKSQVSEDIKTLAFDKNMQWSPDDKKFLYVQENGDQLMYKVYNLEDPLPVGEKVETTVFITNKKDAQPKISWYMDSYHLILAEGDTQKEHRGKVSFIRIDGTNKTEVYNNTLYSDSVFSSPQGDKLIILTSFKSGGYPDLYTLSIR